MDACIQSCLDALQFSNSFIHGRMEVIPLTSTQEAGPGYLTLSEALAQDLILITEVNREGSVPELTVVNRGTIPVLLLDGEEIAGAKQNRVLNTTILVPGEAELIIPVSCTEHGRWRSTSFAFSDSRVMMDYKIRQKKMSSVGYAMKERASRHSDQGEIWNEIREVSRKAKVQSSTGAMKDVFESRAAAMDLYLAAFPLQPGQQGVLIYLDNRLAGMEFLSSPEAYALIHEKLIRSYVLEALIDDEIPPAPEAVERAKEFLQRVASCAADAYPGVGLGTEYRLEGGDLVGSALVHGDVVVHLACFTGASTPPGEKERMAGFRARRDARTSRPTGANTPAPGDVQQDLSGHQAVHTPPPGSGGGEKLRPDNTGVPGK